MPRRPAADTAWERLRDKMLANSHVRLAVSDAERRRVCKRLRKLKDEIRDYGEKYAGSMDPERRKLLARSTIQIEQVCGQIDPDPGPDPFQIIRERHGPAGG